MNHTMWLEKSGSSVEMNTSDLEVVRLASKLKQTFLLLKLTAERHIFQPFVSEDFFQMERSLDCPANLTVCRKV